MARRRIPAHQLDIYDDVVLYLFTRLVDFEWWCDRNFEGEDDRPPAWESVGRVTTAHHGDGTDGLPAFHVAICLHDEALAHPDTELVDVIKTVTHEATHAAGLILDHVGQPYDGVSEALAYLAGWITKWVWVNLPDDMRHAHV